MQVFLSEARQKLNALKGALPSKLYVPFNSGRRVGKKVTNAALFTTEREADQIDLEAWIDYRASTGEFANLVDLTSTQTISGTKTFSGATTLSNASVTLSGVPTYADDAAAGAGGLTAGQVYQTATGELRIKT